MSLPRFNEAQLARSAARLRLRRFIWPEPVEDVMYDEDSSYFYVCLTPRPGRAWGTYLDRFAPSDYAPIGPMLFVPAGRALRARSEAGRPWTLQCWFQAGSFEALDIPWDDARLRAAMNIRSPALQHTAMRLAMEMSDPGFASEVVIDALCTMMMVDVVRYLRAPPSARAVRGGLPAWRLRQIDERVRQAGGPPTMDELARLCALSPRHLMRAFRQQTGQTIGAHIEQVRIERAKALLAKDDARLKEVAAALGFGEVSAFSHAFQRATGERPSVYRARTRAETQGAFVSVSRNSVG